MKRVLAFLLIVVVSLGVIVWTSPSIVNSIRLGLDLKGGFEILYQASPLEPGGKITSEALKQTARSLDKRINATGTSEPEITIEGSDRIRVKIADVKNEEEVRKKLKEPSVLTFRSSDGCKEATDYCKVELQGTDFVEGGASVVFNELHQPIVAIKLKDAGKFSEITKRLASLAQEDRNRLAIFMDEHMISDPRVSYEIPGGEATITGQRTNEEANELRDTINLGSLPLKLTEKYSQSVAATLGKLSLDQTVKAGLIGTALILLFMLIVYRLPGVIASFSLILFTWLLLIVFWLSEITLTLPGIAAFILGLGMAVDANIITYERIKEELRSGKSISSSMKAGSKNSFRTIMDANITTIIAGVVMYVLGESQVKGFALILMMTVVVSIFTNVFLSRIFLHMLVKARVLTKPGYFGVKESEIRAL
ncbi:protein translocase subunit SecD [Paenibacillus apiarius]|uniref:Protein translocase subunit SecD n=1 Tax=Paenibacillus apiarius TaxID=46240 RepID=A0ABT4E1C2_9BACL|nr:protein translocase subunit SecD [Paenibacillus apiarius]MBN3525704.1 protein translocase subunit SecD [Paenibacillus apiarius]MCY9512935.1 protein translocase subunit SecD [Paenibacillus apiarius]MCY9522016.1 protein translocase subunit SecD [Paenibacillus apiarius]MCY9555061.1 protein translocase subunit SecD [Paenibacillus apiarius]MCY9558081.1 protein translocase subunit SecD [Paenibacillus apiarius]